MNTCFHFPSQLKNKQYNFASLDSYLINRCQYTCRIDHEKIVFGNDSIGGYLSLHELYNAGKVHQGNINKVRDLINNHPYEEHNYEFIRPADIKKYCDVLLKEEDLKKNYNVINILLLGLKNPILSKVFNENIAPFFFKYFPEGSIWFVGISDVMEARKSAIAMLFSAFQIPGLFEARDSLVNKGFSTLRNMENLSSMSMDNLIAPLFLLFSPYSCGFSCQRPSGIFIFSFGKSINYLPPFPWRLQDIYRNDTSYHAGYRETTQKHKKRYEVASWNNSQFVALFKWYIHRLNELIKYLLDPGNFIDDNGELQPDRQFYSGLTINRIIYEVLIVLSEYQSQYLKRSYLFSSLDKISMLLEKSAGNKTNTKEPEIFKNLFRESFITKKISPIISAIPSPFGNYFRNRSKEVLKDINKTIIDGIFIDILKKVNSIRLKSKGVDREESKEDYIVNYLREIRNTHHGYIIKKPEYICINNGNISNLIPEIAGLYLLVLLSDVRNITEGKIL